MSGLTMHKRTLTVLCLAAMSLPAAADETVDEGRELYLSFQCWQCHGYEGQGGAAARIASISYPVEAFARFLRNPKVMPAYPPSMLSDDEVRLIYDYVRSIPEPPALEDIPALRDE